MNRRMLLALSISIALAAASAASAQTLLFEWTQTVGSRMGPPFNTWNATKEIAAGDIDGDGDLDVISTFPSGGGLQRPQLFLNDGDAVFVGDTQGRLPAVIRGWNPVGDVILGDVDGDGDLDLCMAWSGITTTGKFAQPQALFLNNGKGFFSDVSAKQLPTTKNPTSDLALVDIDGDKDLDMVLATFAGHPFTNRVYVNNGKGTFTDETIKRMPFGQFWSNSLATGDVDGDGDIDLVIVSGQQVVNGGMQNELYLNDGKGAFTRSATGLPRRKDISLDAVLCDCDGDKDLDLFVAGTNFSDALLLNNGKGVFVDGSTQLPKPHSRYYGAMSAAPFDYDGDSDVDLVVADGSTRTSLLYRNDGKARFTYIPRGYALGHGFILDYAVGDFDGDGDLDVASTGVGTEINLNLQRHVLTRVPPKLGGSYPLELHAKPGRKLVWAFSALGRGKLPVPGIGTFGLDTRVMLPWPVQFPNAAGQVTIPVTLPNDSRLLGQTLATQTLVYDLLKGRFSGFSNVASDLVK